MRRLFAVGALALACSTPESDRDSGMPFLDARSVDAQLDAPELDAPLLDAPELDAPELDANSDTGPIIEPRLTLSEILLHGGGTHNAVAYSPNGLHLAAFADVGATRVFNRADDAWRYRPVSSVNGHRQVAGGVILDDGTILQTVGNGAAGGELLELSPDGTTTSLARGLAIFANRLSVGDMGPRPRPVGWVVAFDESRNLVYYCTEDGVRRYDRGAGVDDGIIALSGASCRGFGHTNHGHLVDPDRLVVCTRTRGLVELSDPSDDVRASRVSPASWPRFEDAALIDAERGSYLAAGHAFGAYRFDGDGGLILSSQTPVGSARSIRGQRYELGLEAELDWSRDSGTLLSKWDTSGGAAAQQHRFELLGGGMLRYRYRHSGGALSSVEASAPLSLSGRGFVRVRRSGNEVRFDESGDGIVWESVGVVRSVGDDVPDENTNENWVVGGTHNGADSLPMGTTLHQAWARSLGTSEPEVSLDLRGVIAGESSALGVSGDAWRFAGTLTPGGVDVTPAQSNGEGANAITLSANIRVAGNVATVTTAANHVVTPGSIVRITNASAPGLDGAHVVAARTSARVYTFETNRAPVMATANSTSQGATRWLAAATMEVGDDVVAALAVVNPESASEWVYRSRDIESAPSWENASPSEAVLQPGSTYFSPENRILGASAGGGRDLVGVFNIAFDPSDGTGNTLLATAALSLYRSTNFLSADAPAIAWTSFNRSLSMLSLLDVFIDAEGGVTWTAADHNAYVVDASGLLDEEPQEASFSGIPDAWGVASIGAGADKVTILAASSDIDSVDSSADVGFHRGAGPVGSWSTTGYQNDTNGMGALSPGEVPRPGGAFLWNRGDGTYGAVVYGDGVGWIRSTYSLAERSWSTWRAQEEGPTGNLTTADVNGVRPIVGDSDGVPLVAMHLSTGEVYVSTDGEGAVWRPIDSTGAPELRRKGRIAYDAESDIAIVSDSRALRRIDGVSTPEPRVTVIDDARRDYGPVAFDAAGRVYVHMHDTGELLRFESFALSNSLVDAENLSIGSAYESRVGGLAMQMRIGVIDGVERGITTYQGSGAVSWTVPD